METDIQSRLDYLATRVEHIKNIASLENPSASEIDELRNVVFDVLVNINKLLDVAVFTYFKLKVFPRIDERQRETLERKILFPIAKDLAHFDKIIKSNDLDEFKVDHPLLFQILYKYQLFSQGQSDSLSFLRKHANQAHRIPIIQFPRNKHVSVNIQEALRVNAAQGVSARFVNCIVRGKRIVNLLVKDSHVSGIVETGTSVTIETRYIYKVLDRDVVTFCDQGLKHVKNIVQEIGAL